ncbi:hypothetical protein [Halapricum desulfuricans]|uniref:Putative membrane protein n=1 Tax=Halapricum desulfuricans TaxID=2841257 RepID=A0A897N6T8_9EURY|nr:hypothetical protein [Halapricum desulfuricans]QSG06086.1 putative membrane protein [Halapricum desulfuricans]
MTSVELPDAERRRGLLVSILSFFEARLLSIIFLLIAMLATIAYFFAGWSPPRWLLVVLAAVVFSIPFGLATGVYSRSVLSTTDWVYLVDLDARTVDMAIYRMPPHELARVDVLEGDLAKPSPRIYLGKAVDLDARTCKGTWPGTLDDRELLASLHAVRRCRGKLEEDAKKGFALRSNLHAIVRQATRKNVLQVVETFERGALPGDGQHIDESVTESIDSFDVESAVDLDVDLPDDLDADDLGLDDLDADGNSENSDGLGDLFAGATSDGDGDD